MGRGLSLIAVGCACAALAACGSPRAAVSTAPSNSTASLPHPSRAWNEDFASAVELESITVSNQSVLVPEGIRVPQDSRISVSSEAMLVLYDDDAAAVRRAVEQSCAAARYKHYSSAKNVSVWVGRGMAVRLETDADVQMLAWGPEAMKDEFASAP